MDQLPMEDQIEYRNESMEIIKEAKEAIFNMLLKFHKDHTKLRIKFLKKIKEYKEGEKKNAGH